MLTERERHGMAELLGRMDPADLISLAQVAQFVGQKFLLLPQISQTVTSRLLVADTPAEAVENIILHTDKVGSGYFSLKLDEPFLVLASFQAWLPIMDFSI